MLTDTFRKQGKAVVKVHHVRYRFRPVQVKPVKPITLIKPIQGILPKWWLIGTTTTLIVFGAIFVAVAVAVSLIPLYLPKKSATYQPVYSPLLTYSFNITNNGTPFQLPLDDLPANILSLIEAALQKQVDGNPQTAGSKITIISAALLDARGGQKESYSSQFLRLTGTFRLQYSKSCTTKSCQSKFLTTAESVALGQLIIDQDTLFQAVLTVTTTVATTTQEITIGNALTVETSTVTTTGADVSNGVTTETVTPAAALVRGRRHAVDPSTYTNHESLLGGCLLVGPEKNDVEATQGLYNRHAFMKRLPLGVEAVPGVDGQQIDLYKHLQDKKLTKSSYEQLIIQNRLINGHYLTIGALGCLEPHVRAWERVVELNRPMIIFEDDAQLKSDIIDEMMPKILEALPKNFGLLYFGNLVGDPMLPLFTDHNELLWKINGSNWGTYTYMISPLAAATLLDFVYPVHAQVDSMIIEISQAQKLDVYITKQILVKTDNTFRRVSRTQRYIIPPIVIPRIFHFIWLTNNTIPEASQRNLRLWKELHPNWQVQLWTKEMIYNGSVTMYNKDRFEKSARSPRQASDVIRYDILYQYGGVYLDMDFEPLKNIEPLLHGVQAFVVHENKDFICNGIYGNIPGHALSERLVLQLESNWRMHENGTVNQQTGPYHITKQVNELKIQKKTGMKNGFQTFSPHIFFPYAWFEKDPGAPYDQHSYSVHHFRPFEEIEKNGRDRS